jgi:hypothetical protein
MVRPTVACRNRGSSCGHGTRRANDHRPKRRQHYKGFPCDTVVAPARQRRRVPPGPAWRQAVCSDPSAHDPTVPIGRTRTSYRIRLPIRATSEAGEGVLTSLASRNCPRCGILSYWVDAVAASRMNERLRPHHNRGFYQCNGCGYADSRCQCDLPPRSIEPRRHPGRLYARIAVALANRFGERRARILFVPIFLVLFMGQLFAIIVVIGIAMQLLFS